METQSRQQTEKGNQDGQKFGSQQSKQKGTMAEHNEVAVAKAIEKETSKFSSDLLIWTGLSLLGALALLHYEKKASQLIGKTIRNSNSN
jgi:hypothetical protein